MLNALRVIRGLLAFLTAIPVKMDESFLDISARYMFLFPIIGALIGFIVGIYARFTGYLLFLLLQTMNNVVFSGTHELFFCLIAKGFASVMTIAFLLVVIGLQHTDGLVDVGNALGIRKASLKEKVDIAHELAVTRLGAFLALFISTVTFLIIFLTKTDVIIQAIIVAETIAKLAMVTTGWQGTSPPPRFYENRWEKGRSFIDSIKNKHDKYAFSLIISIVVSFVFFGFNAIFMVGSGILVGCVMIVVGKHVFGGVNGDIFGATNEIARMFALFVILVVSLCLL